MPFVLIAAAILLTGGLMLALRSSDGLLSVLLQAESSDARDAAETGLTRILGELNRPRNRGLLAKDESAEDSDGYLWISDDLGASRNPCLPRQLPAVDPDGDAGAPDLVSNPSIGFRDRDPASSEPPTYATVLLDASGDVVSDPEAAVKAYRLVGVQRMPLRRSDGTASLRVFEAEGRGRVVLTVEGSALRNGRSISSVRLQEELQLVPKCCDVSFGGAHGDSDYTPDGQGGSICIREGWGFMAGMALNGSGEMTINGVTTISDLSGQSVNPLLCFAEPTQDCSFNPTSTDYSLRLVHPDFRPVPGNPVVAPSVRGTISRDTAPQDYPREGASQPFLHCTDAGATPASLKECPGGRVTINAAAESFPLHQAVDGEPYCRVGNGSAQDAPDSVDALHCNLSQIIYSQLTIRFVGTDPVENPRARALRLYFPVAPAGGDDVIRSTGGGSLEHQGPAARFALFGCADCAAQSIRLAGSPAGINLLAWFPRGDVTVSGSSEYQGVLWANTITSSGGVTWTIPPAAVRAALELAGFGLEGERNPPAFDWVARSVRAFRWLGL